MPSANRKKKLLLHSRDPHCCYCGVLTVITNISKGTLPPNAATLEHLIPRLDPRRLFPQKGERRHALACCRCNNEKSGRDQSDYLTPEQIKIVSIGDASKRIIYFQKVIQDLESFDCF